MTSLRARCLELLHETNPVSPPEVREPIEKELNEYPGWTSR